MQIRKMLAAFISFMMIYPVVSVSAFAVDETQIVTDLVSPAYEYAAKTENYLTITSSTADCKSLCNGMAGVTQITVEHTLEIRFHADKLKRQERNYHYLQRRRNNLNILIVAKTT